MTKKIPLSASGLGQPSKRTEPIFALVDDDDYDWLMEYNWTAISTHRANGGYASRVMNNGKTTTMHRQIMGAKKGEEIDHKDGNGLNNQRSNLRKATRTQNIANRSHYRTSKSGYKGVHLNKQNGHWKMNFSHQFDTPEDAARAYDRCAKMFHGDMARLNFPESTENANSD